MNLDVLYDIYNNSISKNKLTKADFKAKFKEKSYNIFLYQDKAFFIRDKNVILLLCVKEDYKNQGIGSSLLKKCEEDIKREGYNRAKLGVLSNNAFLKGVPFQTNEFMFFDNRGYEDTKIISDNLFSVDMNFKTNPDVTVEYLKSKDYPMFKMYYDLYDYKLLDNIDMEKPIIIARDKSQYIGFCQIDEIRFADFEDKIGLVTNLFILPKYRKTEEGYSILEFIKNEFKNKEIKNFEIINFNSSLLEKNISGKEYVKYYVGSKDLHGER
jgi:N-acetylglutamate synthase-like GNAT family acetyltransferase